MIYLKILSFFFYLWFFHFSASGIYSQSAAFLLKNRKAILPKPQSHHKHRRAVTHPSEGIFFGEEGRGGDVSLLSKYDKKLYHIWWLLYSVGFEAWFSKYLLKLLSLSTVSCVQCMMGNLIVFWHVDRMRLTSRLEYMLVSLIYFELCLNYVYLQYNFFTLRGYKKDLLLKLHSLGNCFIIQISWRCFDILGCFCVTRKSLRHFFLFQLL